MSLKPATVPSAPTDWRTVLSLSDEGDPALARLRGYQLAGFMQQLPLTMFSVVAAGGALVAMFYDTPHAAVAFTWLAGLVVLSTGLFIMGTRIQNHPRLQPQTVGERGRSLREIAMLATLTAALFSSLPIYIVWQAPSAEVVYAVAVAQVATIAVCAFLLASAPLAAMGFLAVFALALGFSAFRLGVLNAEGFGILLLGCVLAAVVFRGVLGQARTLARQVRQLEELRARGEVIGLLLHEFEQNSRDWLWEVNAEGLLTHASARFTSATGLPIEAMLGRVAARSLRRCTVGGLRHRPGPLQRR